MRFTRGTWVRITTIGVARLGAMGLNAHSILLLVRIALHFPISGGGGNKTKGVVTDTISSLTSDWKIQFPRLSFEGYIRT